jgi:hypothetical protein
LDLDDDELSEAFPSPTKVEAQTFIRVKVTIASRLSPIACMRAMLRFHSFTSQRPKFCVLSRALFFSSSIFLIHHHRHNNNRTVINRSFETFSLLYSSNNYNRNMDKLEPYIKKVDDFIAQYPSLTFYGTSNRIFLCCCVSVENFELFATSRASSKMTAALFPGARREPSKLPTENVFTIPIQHDCGLYHTTFTEADIKAAN